MLVGSKKKKKYDCEICGRIFLHLGRLDIHKACHKNVKFRCSEENCDYEKDTKLAVEEHHRECGHSGITIIESLENYVSTYT